MDALFLDGIDQGRHGFAAAGKGFAGDHRLRRTQGVTKSKTTAGRFIGQIGFHVVGCAGHEPRQHRAWLGCSAPPNLAASAWRIVDNSWCWCGLVVQKAARQIRLGLIVADEFGRFFTKLAFP
ncbi:hypothetical protein, partial [Sandarakinorhabdus sp.]|uniref:hypothetical protein n=1 Tax=Sandarakinorhabdus sp. TaxID=1916663 RepID=UPI0028A867C3